MNKLTEIGYAIIAGASLIMVVCFFLLYQLPAANQKPSGPLDTSRDIVIYTKSSCPYCVWAKQLLDEKRIAYKEVDMTGNEQKHYDMYLETGQKTVPYVYVDGELIGGYNSLVELSKEW